MENPPYILCRYILQERKRKNNKNLATGIIKSAIGIIEDTF